MTDSRPTKWAVVQYWSTAPLGHEVFAPHLSIDSPCCFACGWLSERWKEGRSAKAAWGHARLERAHIVPASLGGSADVSNIILLCAPCHRESPDWHEPSEMARWISERPERGSKEVEELSDWFAAMQQAPEFGTLVNALAPESDEEMRTVAQEIVQALWASAQKTSLHASALSAGSKAAILRDVAVRYDR